MTNAALRYWWLPIHHSLCFVIQIFDQNIWYDSAEVCHSLKPACFVFSSPQLSSLHLVLADITPETRLTTRSYLSQILNRESTLLFSFFVLITGIHTIRKLSVLPIKSPYKVINAAVGPTSPASFLSDSIHKILRKPLYPPSHPGQRAPFRHLVLPDGPRIYLDIYRWSC